MGLYLENGYLNIEHIMNYGTPWTIIVGARATGKTFGVLKYILDNDIRFMYLRRTQTQLDIIKQPAFSPFNAVNRLCGYNINPQSLTKHSCGFYKCSINADGELTYQEPPIGYGAALTTMHNVRSIDAESINILVYDEFIPERHAPKIREEGAAFFNVCETVNRNRELTGKPPLKVICLANSDTIANPLFIHLGLIKQVERMKIKGQEVSVNKTRGLTIILPMNSPVIAQKAKTSLYTLTQGTDFERVALDNDFIDFDYDLVRPQALIEYKPYVCVGEICIYRHKSQPLFYVSMHKSGSPATFSTSDADILRFKKHYYAIWDKYLHRKVLFEDSTSEVLFNTYMGAL